MKKVLTCWLLWFLFTVAAANAADAQRFVLPERPTAHVNDYAHALTSQERQELEQRFTNFEQQSGHQAAVAIFAETGDEPIEDVAVKLFDKWRLGSKKENDGVMLVLSMKEHDLRIEVGYGLEGQLPDALAGQIIQSDIIPRMREGQTAAAIAVFETRLEEIFIQGKRPEPIQKRGSNPRILFWIIIILIIIMLSRGGSGGNRTIGSNGIRRRNSLFPFIFWGGGGGWGGGGSGWGGGGGGWGGGGGGLSGGGGASGKW